ncbi:MAG TPA: hypothetical protein VF596_08970 [Pyrinomonadaceae bacterium]
MTSTTTIFVENGVLSIYTDIYDRQMNKLENLRSKLDSYGVDVSKTDEKTLKGMLNGVSDNRKFVVSLADLKAGN